MKLVCKKPLSLLLALVMLISLFSGLSITASANNAISGGDTISTGGTYLVDANATGVITVATNEEVVLVGSGITASANQNLSISYNIAGAKLTIKNLHIKNTADLNAICFTGEGNTLSISEQNLLEGQGYVAVIRVAPVVDLTIDSVDNGTLYLYKNTNGAGIGGNGGDDNPEGNGIITISGGNLFLKGTKTGAVIGGGEKKEAGTATGDIYITGGVLNIEANAQGAAIGGSKSSNGGNVYISGGTVTIVNDFSGSSIGAGADGAPSGKDGGNLAITGGSLKSVINSNAGSSWGTSTEQNTISDASITAKKTDGTKPVYRCVFDTNDLATTGDTSFAIKIDGNDYYTSGLHAYDYSKSEVSTIDNWVVATDSNLYLYLTGENHLLTVNGENFNATWDQDSSSFTISKPIEYTATFVAGGTTVDTVNFVAGAQSIEEPEVPAKEGSIGKWETYTLGTESITINAVYGNVNATVWDGAVDVTWYNTTDKEFTLSTPAQLAGLAAIVNGVVLNDAPVAGNKAYVTGSLVKPSDVKGWRGIDDFDGKTIKLAADLDMGGTYNTGGGTWSGPAYAPIGGQWTTLDNVQAEASFNGTFDGRGHTVSNIYCELQTGQGSQSMGLIGRLGIHDSDVSSGLDTLAINPTVKNVAVNGYIKGGRSVGGVVGKIGKTAGGGIIENCANFATVIAPQKKGVGGVCGTAWNGGTIKNCYNAGSVTGTSGFDIGGIAGSNESTLINCYNIGTIAFSSGSGTTAAIATHSSGSYTNCYWLDTSAGAGLNKSTSAGVTSKTSTEMQEAGFAALLNGEGAAFEADTKNINNGYPIISWQATAMLESIAVTTAPSYTAYLAGQNFDTTGMVVTATYNDGSTAAIMDYTVPQEPLTDADTQVTIQYNGAQTTQAIKVFSEADVSWYSQATQGEYAINTANKLTVFAHIVNGTIKGIDKDDFANKTIKLTRNIALDTDGKYTSGTGVFGQNAYAMDAPWYAVNEDAKIWTPIGSGVATNNTTLSSSNYFAGTFDGDGKTISGLYTNGAATVQGLFGCVSGTVKNVTVTSGCVTGKFVVGGIAAYLNGGTIENCTNNAVIYADGGQVGDSGIENGVKNTGAVGGIVGNATGSEADPAAIKACINNGSITCTNTAKGGRAGGVLGLIDDTSDYVSTTDCFNTGKVDAYQYAGGIVGMNNSGSAPISGCVNSGEIIVHSSGSAYAGGIASITKSNITNCYNTGNYKIVIDGTSRNKGAHLGGIVSDLVKNGTIQPVITNCYNTGTFSTGGNATTASNYGAICGAGYGNTEANNLVNCYTTSAIGEDYTKACVTLVTNTELKALAKTLGDAYVADTVIPNINNGYPILEWQANSATITFAVSPTDSTIVVTHGEDIISANSDGTYTLSIGNTYEYMVTPADTEYVAQSGKLNVTVDTTVTVNLQGWAWGTQGHYDTAWYGDGSADIFQIDNAQELAGLAYLVNNGNNFAGKTIQLTADVMLNHHLSADQDYTAHSWTSISSGQGTSFQGVFDGQGHMVKNIYVYDTSDTSRPVGLFGAIDKSAVIRNVGVTGYIRAYRYVGGIAGLMGSAGSGNSPVIEGCANYASIIGNASGSRGVGGIVGNAYGVIRNCYNAGSVHDLYRPAGGIAGLNANTTIENCYNTGTVSSDGGAGWQGAIAATLTGANAIIKNCYWLDSSCTSAVSYVDTGTGASETNITNVESKTAEEMRSAGLIDLLNGEGDAFAADRILPYYNNGYPIASWQNNPATITFEVKPAKATLELTHGEDMITANQDGTYTLKVGQTYSYTASANGYSSKNGSITVSQNETISITLKTQSTGGTGGGGGGTATPAKPTITTTGDGGKASADSNGNVTITVEQGYQVKDVLVNGVSKGALTSLKGLKSTDKVEVIFEKTAEVQSPQKPADAFDDATNHWAKDSINFVLEKGLFKGISNTAFEPDATMTRAMLVTVLHRLAGNPAGGSVNFSDVVPSQWYSDAVVWAAANNIISGYSDEIFGTNDNITREQLVAILYNYAKTMKLETSTEGMGISEFGGAAQVSEWAKDAMRWAIQVGIMSGKTGNILDPGGTATRAEVATILHRFVETIAK